MIEGNVGIICACIMVLPAFFEWHWPKPLSAPLQRITSRLLPGQDSSGRQNDLHGKKAFGRNPPFYDSSNRHAAMRRPAEDPLRIPSMSDASEQSTVVASAPSSRKFHATFYRSRVSTSEEYLEMGFGKEPEAYSVPS